jgi:LacI family transcriptional regulator
LVLPLPQEFALIRRSRTTLQEIARAAGVSATTVSNVVNGRQNLMSAETWQRVESTIRDLNYRPNEEARSLRLSQRRMIGLIVVGGSPAYLADPMITNIVAGLSNFLGVNGYGLLVTGVAPAAVDSAHILRRDQTDAICVIPSGTGPEQKRLYAALAELGQPVVVFQDDPPKQFPDCLSIQQDDFDAGAMIGQLLAKSGVQTLVFIGTAQPWHAVLTRERGLRSTFEAAGRKLITIASASEEIEDVRQAVTRHIERNGLPDAFVGANDQMAIGALNWALDHNLRVPQDVRVAGFNGFGFADFVRPLLTTVRSPAYEMGRAGAEQLLRRLAGNEFATDRIVLPVELRPGNSA